MNEREESRATHSRATRVVVSSRKERDKHFFPPSAILGNQLYLLLGTKVLKIFPDLRHSRRKN